MITDALYLGRYIDALQGLALVECIAADACHAVGNIYFGKSRATAEGVSAYGGYALGEGDALNGGAA